MQEASPAYLASAPIVQPATIPAADDAPAPVNQPPDFDPYELLGVDASADAATIDRAYKARIRFVHPDIAGTAGLNEAKRLNVAREWLLDPELRALLPRPRPRWRDFRRKEPTAPAEPPRPPEPPQGDWQRRPPQGDWQQQPPQGDWQQRPPQGDWQKEPQPPPRARPRPSWEYDPAEDDPLTFDYGPHEEVLRAFLDSIRTLNDDERARLTYSLGDEPPLFFDEFKAQLGEVAWARSRALEDAIDIVWREGHIEETPLLFPRGRVFGNGAVVANAYAQWLLLGDAIAGRGLGPEAVAALAARCTWPWNASVGYERYGSSQREVLAFLGDAESMSPATAEWLSRSWQRHMGRYVYGRPGDDWFPGSNDFPKPQLVSARLAAVDASRIEPPDDLPWQLHNGFRYGLRLTAHVLGLGGIDRPGRDYLRPWREAMDSSPSFADRARWGMPKG